MKRRARIRYSEADKALMWDRWQKGDSLHAIAGLSDRNEKASESDGDCSGVRGVIIGLLCFRPKIATENNNVFERTNSKKPG